MNTFVEELLSLFTTTNGFSRRNISIEKEKLFNTVTVSLFLLFLKKNNLMLKIEADGIYVWRMAQKTLKSTIQKDKDTLVNQLNYINSYLTPIGVQEKHMCNNSDSKFLEELLTNFSNASHINIKWELSELTTTDLNKEKIFLKPSVFSYLLEHLYHEGFFEQNNLKKNGTNKFKKHISEKKKKGIYYTPKNIVTYICNVTLTQYISSQLNQSLSTVEEFIETSSTKKVEFLSHVLDELIIVDPACGTGSFLIHAAQILYQWKWHVYQRLQRKIDPFVIKWNILTHNLYGIDLDIRALKIAKIRLLLWLLSEINVPSDSSIPLPTLFQNFHHGHALIGITKECELFKRPLKKSIEASLSKAFKWFDFEHPTLHTLNDAIEVYNKVLFQTMEIHRKDPIKAREQLTLIKKIIYSHVNPYFFNKIAKFKGITDNFPFTPFHWNIEFQKVFKNSGGLPILVGNPPYGATLTPLEQKIIQNTYGEFDITRTKDQCPGTKNISAIFLARIAMILQNNGCWGFIIPNSIARIPQFCQTRRILWKYFHLFHIVDEGFPFPQVNLEMISMFGQKIPMKYTKGYIITRTVSRKTMRQKEYFIPLYKSIQLDYIPLYYDHLFERLLNRHNKRLKIKVVQGRPRRADYIQEKKGIRCISSRMIDRYTLKLEYDTHRYVSQDFRYIDHELEQEFPITPYFFGTNLKSMKKDIFEVTLKPKGYITDGNAILFLVDNHLFAKALVVFFNSKIVNNLVKKYILNYSIRDITIRNATIAKLPIPNSFEDYIPLFAKTASLLLFLHQYRYLKSKTKNKQHSPPYYINKLLKIVENSVNRVITQLYFSDTVDDDLVAKMTVCTSINTKVMDQWRQLYFQYELKKERKEIMALKQLEHKIVTNLSTLVTQNPHLFGW